MKRITRQLLFWTPRILCMAFTLFISLFALDVFEPGRSASEIAIALFIHLIPVYVLIIVQVFAWRREWVGAAAFFSLSLFYVIITGGREHWSAYLIITGTLLVLSALYLMNWIHRTEIRKR